MDQSESVDDVMVRSVGWLVHMTISVGGDGGSLSGI